MRVLRGAAIRVFLFGARSWIGRFWCLGSGSVGSGVELVGVLMDGEVREEKDWEKVDGWMGLTRCKSSRSSSSPYILMALALRSRASFSERLDSWLAASLAEVADLEISSRQAWAKMSTAFIVSLVWLESSLSGSRSWVDGIR